MIHILYTFSLYKIILHAIVFYLYAIRKLYTLCAVYPLPSPRDATYRYLLHVVFTFSKKSRGMPLPGHV